MKFPILLGHEGAGVVEESAPASTSVAAGDRVVIAWRARCGDDCPSCNAATRGAARTISARSGGCTVRSDGALLTPVLRCGTSPTA